MGKFKADKNAPIEERLNYLETVMKRLALKKVKKVSVIIPPFPICGNLKGDIIAGEVINFMFPCDGRIKKCGISLDKKPEKVMSVHVELIRKMGGETKLFRIDEQLASVDVDIIVSSFDRLIVSVGDVDATSVWASILWVPAVSYSDLKSFAIEELEKELLEE